MLKLKMMLCVMMLPLVVIGCTSKQSVSQCVEATTASGVDVGLPDWQTPLNGIISPSERLITTQQLEGTQKYINERITEMIAYIDGQLMPDVNEQYTRASGGV